MITINLTKAKDIAHEMRRAVRDKEFAPLDLQATIPAKAAEAEAARQVIRDKHAQIQSNINAAASVQELKAIVDRL